MENELASLNDISFGDHENALVGYVIYAHNGFCLFTQNQEGDLTTSTIWLGNAAEPYVWSVDNVNKILTLAIDHDWEYKPQWVRKAMVFKETGKVVILESPLKIGHLLAKTETIDLVIYGCKVGITINSSGGGDPQRGIDWVKRALQMRLDALKEAVERDDLV